LTATTADPTHDSDTNNDQSYVEANTFINSQSAVPAGEDGLWDFSLQLDTNAQKGTSYCVRPTKSDGTLFNNYDVYPRIDVPTTSLNHAAFRFFANQDSTAVGSALASQDTDITRSPGQDFRLRSLFHVSGLGFKYI
jgi:hypothetical protein